MTAPIKVKTQPHHLFSFCLSLALSILIFFLPFTYVQAQDCSFSSFTAFGQSALSQAIVTGDMNGDGAIDIIIGNAPHRPTQSGGQNALYLNDGLGTFQQSSLFGTSTEDSTSIAVGDLNGDGTLDVVVGNRAFPEANEDGKNKIYFNDGSGQLELSQLFGDSTSTTSLSIADMDGDGGLDIITGNDGAPNAIYFNDAEGNFDTHIEFGATERTMSIVTGHLNNDIHPDIVVGNSVGVNQVYLNSGNRVLASGSTFGDATGQTLNLVLADFDGNGTFDIATTRLSQPSQLFFNNGSGEFTTDTLVGTINFSSSLDAGDLNGDGAVDLVVDDQFIINNGDGSFDIAYAYADNSLERTGVAVADFNGDGSLDIASANHFAQNQVFLNSGNTHFSDGTTFGSSDDRSEVIAVADFNQDGLLDVVVGDFGTTVEDKRLDQIYLNDGEGNLEIHTFLGLGRDTLSIAAGDLNGDNAPEIISGHAGRNYVHINDGFGNFDENYAISDDSAYSESIVIADLNNDNYPDVIIGNHAQFSPDEQGFTMVYLNDGSGQFEQGIPFGAATSNTESIVVADLNGDEIPDIVEGNNAQPNQVYLNDGTGHLAEAIQFGTEKSTLDLAVGDFNQDGFIDVISANNSQQSQIFFNSGQGRLGIGQPLGNINNSYGVVAGDFNRDGIPDIVTANSGDPEQLYINDGSGTFEQTFALGNRDSTWDIATGDFNGDGTLDIVTSQSGQNELYLNSLRAPSGLTNNPIHLSLQISAHNQISTTEDGAIIGSQYIIPVAYTLADSEDGWVGHIKLDYSLNGGISWIPAIPTADTVVTNLRATKDGSTYNFNWDTFASGFFGESKNVLLRLTAYPQSTSSESPSIYSYHNSVAGPFQWPAIQVQTEPFYVRATQVRVVHENENGQMEGVENAIVYHRQSGQPAAMPIQAAESDAILRTATDGFLRGRGELTLGSELVALWPISSTQNYTLYHTSALSSSIGLGLQSVITPGVQSLLVSADNPLILFNLVVSLEWDARQDSTFLQQLKVDIQKSSQILFDLTNGQAALGTVHIYHEKGFWGHANIVIHASNRQRPSAVLGGIVQTPTDDIGATGVITDAYIPGQIRMPPKWNRFGDAEGVIGEDWPRVFAHELIHYLFFVPDNYLGFTDSGQLTIIDCKGSVMTDPYDPRYSELLGETEWIGDCANTLAARYLNRTDWQTVSRFYPFLKQGIYNQGPTSLPLAVTRIQEFAPPTSTLTLASPFFKIQTPSGNPLPLPRGSAQGFLIKRGAIEDLTDDYIIQLGTPVGDKIHARGAAEGDRLCVFNNDGITRQIGCNIIKAQVEPLTLHSISDWQPDIRIQSVNSTTISISVTNTTEDAYEVQLLPARGTASENVPLLKQILPNGNAEFTQILQAPEGAYFGFVRVWVPDSQPYKEAIIEFTNKDDWRGQGWAWGGQSYNWGGQGWAWGGQGWAWGGQGWAWGGQGWAWGAPLISGDGQVSIFPLEDPFGRRGNYTIQQLARPSKLPFWITAVGQAYRVEANQRIPNSAILFHYLATDVPPGYEAAIQIYYSPDHGQNWHSLPTELNQLRNHASAQMPGEGIYLLGVTTKIELHQGLNSFGYSINQTRPISDVLTSIEGDYTYICAVKDSAMPWHCSYTDIEPPFTTEINTLTQLEYNHAYLIYVTQPISLYVGIYSDTNIVNNRRRHQQNNNYEPPALYYGWVESTTDFIFTEGMVITAEIDNKLCGQTTVRKFGEQLGYILRVEPGTNCGAVGKNVAFYIDNLPTGNNKQWDNRKAWLHSLSISESELQVPTPTPSVSTQSELHYNYIPLIRLQ